MALDKFFEVSNKKTEHTNKNLDVNFKELNVSPEKVERFLPWFIKYQPHSFKDLVMTNEIKEVMRFIENFQKGKSLLLYGSAGCGKTTTVHLLAREYDLELVEVNASDSRNKKAVDELLGNSVKQQSLFSSSKLVLVDEVDGIAGREDRGGVSEIVKVIKQSSFPIIMAANDIESDKIKPLKKISKLINFENSSNEILLEIGRGVLQNEGIKFTEEALKSFVEKRNLSDIRGFINDLQTASINGEFIPEGLEERDYKKLVEHVISNICELEPEESYKANINTDVNLDDLILYLEENLPRCTKNLFRAFNEIAKADLFRGRIMRWQYWRFLVYVGFYLNYGVSAVVDCKPRQCVRNKRILKKWISGNKVMPLKERTKTQKNKEVPEKFIEKLAGLYNCSVRKARREVLPYFLITYKNSEDFRRKMDKRLEIDESTSKFLLTFK